MWCEQNMTFATPTIIAGDKSNIDVIAHELAHSWSGNLVTNSSWEHFWLNEGWTTYIERRIVGALHGEEMFHFSAIIGWKALKESIELFGEDHEFTKLVINLDGQSSDDAFSSIPYEKIGFEFSPICVSWLTSSTDLTSSSILTLLLGVPNGTSLLSTTFQSTR